MLVRSSNNGLTLEQKNNERALRKMVIKREKNITVWFCFKTDVTVTAARIWFLLPCGYNIIYKSTV